jgi:nitroreductase
VNLPDDHMLFSGMALGYADEAHPINNWRTRRDPLEVWAELRGFD